MHEQLLISVLNDLNGISPDISASAVVSADGLPLAILMPPYLNPDHVGAMSATLLALGNLAVQEFSCGELDQVMVKGKYGYIKPCRRKCGVGVNGQRECKTCINTA